MDPELILAETVALLKIARLKYAKPERVLFLENEVARLTGDVRRLGLPQPTRDTAPHPQGARRGKARVAATRAVLGRWRAS